MEGKKRVLIIENHPDNGKFLADHFNAAGYEAVWIQNGKAALEACPNGGPALIILEMRVEGIEGITLLEAIKSNPVIKEVPIIYISADFRQHQIDWAKAVGASLVVAKPCSNARLEEMAKSLIEAPLAKVGAVGRAA
jgi:CheY-like chemotaxis protein